MASQQTAQLNLVITAKDEAASIIQKTVDDIKKSLSSLQETFDKLNTFKMKNPISQSVVNGIKSRVDEINTAMASIGDKGTYTTVPTSPLANEAKQAQSQATEIVDAMRSVSTEAVKMRQALPTRDVKLLPGAATSLTPVKTALQSFMSEIHNATSNVNNATRRWKSDFNGVVIDVEQDARGVYTAVQDIGKDVKLLPGAAQSLVPIETALSTFISDLNKTSRSVNNATQRWKNDFNGVVTDMEQDARGVYTAVQDIGKDVGDATSWFDKLKSALGSVGSAFRSWSSEATSSFDQFTTKVERDTTKVDSSLNRMKSNAHGARDSLRKGFDYMQLQFAGQQAAQWGQQITGFFYNAVTSAANFNQSVMNVAGSLRAQGESAKQVNSQLKQMNDYALKLGSQGYFSANQVADAMNVMAKQGVSYKTIMGGALQAATNVAAANQEDLSQTANVISDIVHEMGGSLVAQYGNIGSAMKHVGDQMTVALHKSRISMNDFLLSMKYAGPQASNMGMHFSDLAASIAVLGEHGIRGSQAGTTLRRAIQELAAPSATALKEMQALGLATANGTTVFTNASGKLKSMADVQKILYERLQKLNPAQREQALQSMFSMYAVSGMTAIANTTPKTFDAMTKAMSKSGTAQQILAEKSQGVGFQIQHMKAQWQTFIKQLGELFLPLASKVIERLSKIVTTIQSFISQHPGMAKMVAVMLASVGVFALVGGRVASAIGTFGMFKTAITDLLPAIGGLEIGFGPVLLVVAAVVAAVVGLTFAWKHNLGGIQTKTKEAIQDVVQWFKRIQPELTQLKSEIQAVIKFLDPVWKAFWQSFKAVLKATWDEIRQIFQGAWKVISGTFQLFLDVLTGHWSKAWSDVKRIFSGFVEIFEAPFKAFFQMLNGVFNAWATAFETYWKKLWDAIQTLWTNIVGAFNKGKTELSNALSALGKDIESYFASLPSKALQWGENMIAMFAQGIKNAIGSVGKVVGSVANTVKSFLGFHSPTEQGPASDSDQWMPNMMNMFNAGIVQQMPQLKATLGNVAMTIQQTMQTPNLPRMAPANTTYHIANTQNRTGGVAYININGAKMSNKEIMDGIASVLRHQMPVVST